MLHIGQPGLGAKAIGERERKRLKCKPFAWH